jgi:hypothetical protein
MNEPTNEQKIIAYLAKEAMKAGPDNAWISRNDLLNGKLCPVNAGMRLVWAALTMPKGILEWSPDEQMFRLSEATCSKLSRAC